MKSIILALFLFLGLSSYGNAALDIYEELKGDSVMFTELLRYGTYCGFLTYPTPRGFAVVVREERNGRSAVFDADEMGDMLVKRSSWGRGYFVKSYTVSDGMAPVTLRLAHTEMYDSAVLSNAVVTTHCEIRK